MLTSAFTIMNISSELNNRSCNEIRLFGEQVLSDDIETVQRYIVLIYHCLIFLFSIPFTLFTIFLIIKFKHLRDTTFMLPLQVVILDLVNVLIFIPITASTTLSGQWVLGSSLCVTTGVVFSFDYRFRNLLMFVFVFDRFCTVFSPFRYNRYRKKIAFTLWLIALVLSALSAILPTIVGCYGFSRVLWRCLHVQIEHCQNHLICYSYITVLAVIGQITGSYIPLIMYISLFIKAKKIRNQIIPAANVQTDGEQRKRDRKVNLTFFTIFLALFGFTFPPILAFVITDIILPILGVSPIEALVLISFILQELYSLLPIVDSIVILRNPATRKAIQMLKNRIIHQYIN